MEHTVLQNIMEPPTKRHDEMTNGESVHHNFTTSTSKVQLFTNG